jgi:ABC-type transport system substrate-binding protein
LGGDGERGSGTRYDRRSVLQLGAGAMASVAVGGRLARGGPSRGATLTAAARKVGGQLRFGITAESNGVDPTSSQIASAGMCYARAVFDPITIVAADGSIRPYLCQSVTPNATYDLWTFKLRPGISFHDGTRLDSSTFANYLSHIQHSPVAAISAFTTLTSIQQVDSLTVTMQFSAPWVALPAYLTGSVGVGQVGLVAAPSMLANPNGASNPVGTGPFIFVSWEPGSHFVVRRNPNYWQRNLPYLSGITFTPIVDDTSRLQSLQSGTLDLIQTSNILGIQEIVSDTSLNSLTNIKSPPIEPSQKFIMLNTESPPLNDVRVRRALAYATNQKKVIQISNSGLGTPSTGLFSPGSKWYAPTGYPSYNQRKARALVAAYKADHGGAAPTFSLQLGGTTDEDLCQQLQQMWKASGIIVSSIDSVDPNSTITNALDGDYQASSWSQYEAADPDQNYSFWATKNIAPIGQGAINFARFGNATIDAALNTGRSDPDISTRIKAYQTVSDQFAKDVPYVWLTRELSCIASSKIVNGYTKVTLPNGGYALALNDGDIWMQQIWMT